MSLLKSPESHVRNLFAGWFPPLDEFPDGQDGRAFLESETAKALSELAHAALGLRQGLNGLALGVADRSAKEKILSGVHYAIATSSGLVERIGNAVNPPPAHTSELAASA
jgi:hypothetical protein